MKIKMIALLFLFGIGTLFLSHEYSSAQSGIPISKIGTVDIIRVSKECNASKAFVEKTKEDIQKLRAEEEKLRIAIQALEKDLASGHLKVGSPEFYNKNRELAEKEAQLKFPQDFNVQEQSLKNQLWQMDLYAKILKIANDIGAEKDLYLVLSVEEPEISPQNMDDFAIFVKTHKVLYKGGCMDLTDAVIARLNQETKSGN